MIHTGRRVGARASETAQRALKRIVERLGTPEAVGAPRLGGIREALYVRTKRGTATFDISNPDEPQQLHTYEQPV